ncbi:MAG: septum formation protein Maf [Lachnospiraceae bacterium]|nr:septum formation protein Maf [Lachnospiraceae bacterium]
MNKIILASASPRRKELLAQIGFTFEVITSDAEEITKSSQPQQMVEELSMLKAKDVLQKLSKEEQAGAIIIGADTVVSCDGKVLGKPRDKQHAFEMLSLLQGRAHYVYTGVTLIRATEDYQVTSTEGYNSITFHEATAVHVYPMSEEEIWNYIETGEPMDKAGSYGIQGGFAAFIKGIEGDYFNVVGLPIGRVYQELKNF